MRKFLLILAILVVSALGIIWKLKSTPIPVIHPIHGPAIQAVYATGTVEATVMMPIAPRVSARLVKLNADEGYQVKKNQVLAQLEDEDLKSTLRQLQAQESFSRKTYDRNAKLIKADAVAREDYDRSRSELAAARAAVAKAEAEVDYMKLIAPADGIIIKRDGEIGQLIPAGQPLFWLSCCAPLRISAEVDEEDISRIKPGQAVLIRADAFPGKILHGRVQAITPKGDPVARSYRVRVEFMGENPLLIGMTAETNIIISQTDNALLLPSSAVKQNKIWLVRDGKLISANVEIGAKNEEQVEITKGVASNDLVVANPKPDYKEGAKVNYILKP